MYYNKDTVDSCWNKSSTIDELDSNIWRKDFAGALIYKEQYGLKTKYGWTLMKLNPNQNNNVSNLIATHWRNKLMRFGVPGSRNSINEIYPKFKSILTSVDNKQNIEKVQNWTVT